MVQKGTSRFKPSRCRSGGDWSRSNGIVWWLLLQDSIGRRNTVLQHHRRGRISNFRKHLTNKNPYRHSKRVFVFDRIIIIIVCHLKKFHFVVHPSRYLPKIMVEHFIRLLCNKKIVHSSSFWGALTPPQKLFWVSQPWKDNERQSLRSVQSFLLKPFSTHSNPFKTNILAAVVHLFDGGAGVEETKRCFVRLSELIFLTNSPASSFPPLF